MLPAIVFIFSRAACDDAVRQVVHDGVRLTDAQPSGPPSAQVAERRVEPLSDEDLGVLGYDEWLEGLEAGVAAHHAGLVPAFREAVEQCFAAGLLKVVFATETLSLGHQHAGPLGGDRAVHQVRRGGAGHAHLGGVPAADRAGRPAGLDEEGHAVVAVVDRDHLRRGGPGGVGAAARPALVLPAHLQPGRQPGRALRPRRRPTTSSHRSFAQWQARRPDLLSRQLGHRVGRPRASWATSTAGR